MLAAISAFLGPTGWLVAQSAFGAFFVWGLRKVAPAQWDRLRLRGDIVAEHLAAVGVPGGQKIASLLRPTRVASLASVTLISVLQNMAAGMDTKTALTTGVVAAGGSVGAWKMWETKIPPASPGRPVSIITRPPDVLR